MSDTRFVGVYLFGLCPSAQLSCLRFLCNIIQLFRPEGGLSQHRNRYFVPIDFGPLIMNITLYRTMFNARVFHPVFFLYHF